MGDRKSWICCWSGAWLPQRECLLCCVYILGLGPIFFFFGTDCNGYSVSGCAHWMAATSTERGPCWFHFANGWSPAPFPPTCQRIFKPAFTTVMDRAWDRWRSDATRLATSFSRCNHMWFLSMGLRQGSGLCSSSSRKYPGTEGTNQNRHWNHHRWHVTNCLERTWLSCWCFRITKGAHIEQL